MIGRELNLRHIRALLRIAQNPAQEALGRAELHQVIGRYPSNTIASLEARRLVAHELIAGHHVYRLTDRGRRVADELRRELQERAS